MKVYSGNLMQIFMNFWSGRGARKLNSNRENYITIFNVHFIEYISGSGGAVKLI